MTEKKSKKESQLDIIARQVADMHSSMVTKDEAKSFATKNDITHLRTEMNKKFDEVREEMATKKDVHDLEQKLIEDTGAITGTEQKHYRSHAQRIARLEKEVFDKNVAA